MGFGVALRGHSDTLSVDSLALSLGAWQLLSIYCVPQSISAAKCVLISHGCPVFFWFSWFCPSTMMVAPLVWLCMLKQLNLLLLTGCTYLTPLVPHVIDTPFLFPGNQRTHTKQPTSIYLWEVPFVLVEGNHPQKEHSCADYGVVAPAYLFFRLRAPYMVQCFCYH